MVDPEAAALEGGFPGARARSGGARHGPGAKRVGLALEGRAPARDGAEIVDAAGRKDRRRHFGRVRAERRRADRDGLCRERAAAPGTAVGLVVRGKPLAARVAPLPFHPHAYYRGP